MISVQRVLQDGLEEPHLKDNDYLHLLVELNEVLAAPVVLTSKRIELGGDVDLLCRSQEEEALAAALAERGFRPRPHSLGGRTFTQQWVRFVAGSPLIVDLNPVERWGLREPAANALFEEALPLGELRNIRRPAPQHVLLMAARRFVRSGGRLSDSTRRYLADLTAEYPNAWQDARARASGWACTRSLMLLDRTYRDGSPPPLRQRLRVQLDLLLDPHARAPIALARRLRARIPRKPKVLALSGIDGAGKSSQARSLEETFRRLGVPAAVVWRPLGHSPLVKRLRRFAKRILRVQSPSAERLAQSGPPARNWDPNPRTKVLREKLGVLTHAWATIVSFTVGAYYLRAYLRHFGSGRVLIFDRYLLDGCAQLAFFYGERQDVGHQSWFLQLLCPRATASFFLNVPAESALERKSLQYELSELESQIELYKQEANRLEMRELDGTQSSEILTSIIADEFWRNLG